MTQTSRTEIWAMLDRTADAYTERNGTRPNQLVIGSAVAEVLREPGEHPDHPAHLRWHSPTPGVWLPARPTIDRGSLRARWAQRRTERACKALGGHWWHPADPMIAWFCCRCGKDRDGMPHDGT